MSAQFGKCNLDGQPVDRGDLEQARPLLAPYGQDAEGFHCNANVGILFRTLHTTKEAQLERQPHVCGLGSVIFWDGCLDNREQLIGDLKRGLSTGSTDLAIVAAAYEQWGSDAFARLIGDWALSLWDARSRSLVLAKDFVGTRHLYYTINKDQVTWSTILDPLVSLSERSLELCEEYLAGWLSFFPATHLTPYAGIYSVPPSSMVWLQSGKRAIKKYWDFDPGKRILYRTDGEYEEHFRVAFERSVARRLRSDRPVLAELSGGVDSSSIVCMADRIIARGSAETSRLDTVSYYDDSEPNWNERPYFARVEEGRGRTGCHIDVGSQPSFRFGKDTDRFLATPASVGETTEATRKFAMYTASQGNRVLLSGIGGDEVTGGVPTGIPELADLLSERKFKELSHRLKAWALHQRKPWTRLLFDVGRAFLPPSIVGVSKLLRPAPWLDHGFVSRNQGALTGYESRLKVLGPRPSFQENLRTLDALRRQLGCDCTPCDPPYRKRYPYLDRDLLEFLFAVPRRQLIRPGQRRYLIRRALTGIVPDEVLNRKRKAFVVRAPVFAISTGWPNLMTMAEHMISASLGLVCAETFRETMRQARLGEEVQLIALMRTIGLEIWLKGVQRQGIATIRRSSVPHRSTTSVRPEALTDFTRPGTSFFEKLS